MGISGINRKITNSDDDREDSTNQSSGDAGKFEKQSERLIEIINDAESFDWLEVEPCKVLIGAHSGSKDFSPKVVWEGECRKNPPTPGRDGYENTAFPLTAYDCHCSQFER